MIDSGARRIVLMYMRAIIILFFLCAVIAQGFTNTNAQNDFSILSPAENTNRQLLEIKRTEMFWSLIRNSIIFGTLSIGGAGVWIVGNGLYQQADADYKEYNSSYNSDALEILHDKIISLGNTADMLYTIGECSIILSSVFLVWGVIDYCFYSFYDLKISRLRTDIKISTDGARINMCYRF
ncbi:MAG: hypothetical protein HZC28_13295 [Spirochaetes bacterium]|nr:hypothetical protein [Spirochaetota bacterium]